MMMFGLYVRRIALTGSGMPPAEVVLKRGLNVIAGPSDTGKSFIVQCLDYALGGGAAPKDIPQAKGYTTVVLEIELNKDGRIYTLERSLRGGKVRCKTEGQPDRVLAAKHQGNNKETVSQFLLDLSGLGDKKIRTNEGGKTRSLSFRDIARFVIIDEETVITETSPILSGQFTSRTLERGVFRLLLTGTDDSSVVAKEDAKVAKGRQAGKIELLENLLKGVRERLAELGPIGAIADERARLERIEALIQDATIERDAAQARIAPLEAKRHAAWTVLRKVDSKLAVLSELQKRFDLLQEQYGSDLQRLEAIAEASFRLDQFKEERCRVCGALVEHHDKTHQDAPPAPAEVAQACQAEAAKTSRLLQDLQATRTVIAADVAQLHSARDTHQQEFQAVTSDLKTVMEQHVDIAIRKVDELRGRAEACRKVLELLDHMQELEAILRAANTPTKRERAEGPASAVSTAQADKFSRAVEATLRAWHFPELDRVSFSENDQDVVISGLSRKSHGKGVRAIIRAAFNLALLHLCVEDDRPFPNFVLIDSPLLVYEEPDADEASFPQDIKKQFWGAVKASFTKAQVIVIENRLQLPDDDSLKDVNLVLFTGNDHGRRGFIPQAEVRKERSPPVARPASRGVRSQGRRERRTT